MPELIIFIFISIFSFFLTYLYKNWAIKQSILDIPNERSSHLMPVPRGGGVAMVISFYIGLLFLYLIGRVDNELFFALLPGIVLTVMGLMDDLKDLKPIVRFSGQFLCSGVTLYLLGGFDGLFGINMLWIWSFIALFGIVWFINLFNFMDGSDGYASMEAITIAMVLWYFTRMNLLLLLTFSICGFLYWNWPKAKIFMGDSGSTTLGFILVVFGIYFQNKDTLSISIWILITALFWFDATITLIHRILKGERISKAHKNHMYQRAIQSGFSHLKTMLLGFGINILLFIICIFVWKGLSTFLAGLLVTLAILWLVMKYIDRKYTFKSNYL